jgi:hypothetical protein
MNEMTKKPLMITAIMVALILLGLGGIGGGITLLVDPSGGLMGLPVDLLENLFIDDYFLPGIFLILAMGFLPYLVCFTVWRRYQWAWLAVLGQGLLLICWISFQFVLWSDPILLQFIYLAWGISLVIIALLPRTKRYFLV